MKGVNFVEKKISVIMATYNCEKTVGKAIDSILAQTYSNWILIICDDGSTDGTLAILNRYAAQYPEKFLILQNSENKKLPYSLNRCLAHVESELVARMDGDDWSMPNRFQKQVDFLEAHPEYDLVGTGVSVFDGEDVIASIIKMPVPTRESMLQDNAFSHATILMRTRVLRELGGYSLSPSAERVEDVDLWCRFLAADFKGYNLPDELYVILEDVNAAKRRTFQARLNGAITRFHGYRLMGFRGFTCYKPFLLVPIALIPTVLYRKLHFWNLRRQKKGS